MNELVLGRRKQLGRKKKQQLLGSWRDGNGSVGMEVRGSGWCVWSMSVRVFEVEW